MHPTDTHVPIVLVGNTLYYLHYFLGKIVTKKQLYEV